MPAWVGSGYRVTGEYANHRHLVWSVYDQRTACGLAIERLRFWPTDAHCLKCQQCEAKWKREQERERRARRSADTTMGAPAAHR
jgi:hypothetical protein